MNFSPVSVASWPIVLTVLFSQTLAGQTGDWKKIPGPRAADVYSLCLSPAGYVLAGVSGMYPPSGGIYLSTNEGEDWQYIDREDGVVHSMLVGPRNEIYSILSVSGRQFYIYRSTDDGFSWKSTYTGDRLLTCLAINDKGWLFAGTTSVGVLRSTDEGKTWMQIGLDARIYCLRELAGDGLLAGTDRGIFYSPDAALSWSRVSADSISVTSIVRDSGGYFFAGTTKGLYRSTANGREWKKISFDTVTVSTVYTNANGIIFAGTGHGDVYSSSTRGQSWEPLLIEGIDTPIRTIAMTYGGVLLAGTAEGVMRISQGIGRWKTSGFRANQFYSGSITANGTIFVTCRDILFRQGRGETDWEPVNLPTVRPNSSWYFAPIYSTNGKLFLYSQSPPSLCISSDEGITWKIRNVEVATTRSHGLGCWWNRLYFSSDSGAYTSADGETWELVPGTAFNRAGVHCVTASGDIIATLGRDTSARLMRLPAGDTVWQPFSVPAGNHRGFLATSNGSLFHLQYHSVYRLASESLWVKITAPGVEMYWGFTEDREGSLYFGVYGNNPLLGSTDNGKSWKNITPDFLRKTGGYFIYSSDGNVYMESDSNVYRFDGVLTGGAMTEPELLPKTRMISQNYPNPFNPVTTIRFTVPERSYVRMTIYDNSGREVAKPVDEEMPEGDFSIVWNAVGLPSGAYHVRTIVGRFESTFKAVLVK